MKALIALLVSFCFVVVLPMSCNTGLRAYKKVSTDTDVTPQKKQIISPWVSIYFPQETKYIKGKDSIIIKQDTITYKKSLDSISASLDSVLRIHCKELNVDSLIKSVESRYKPLFIRIEKLRIDTFYSESGPTISNLRYQLNQSESKNILLTQQKEALTQEVAAKAKKAKNYLIYFIIACIIALGEAYLLLKPKFL